MPVRPGTHETTDEGGEMCASSSVTAIHIIRLPGLSCLGCSVDDGTDTKDKDEGDYSLKDEHTICVYSGTDAA